MAASVRPGFINACLVTMLSLAFGLQYPVPSPNLIQAISQRPVAGWSQEVSPLGLSQVPQQMPQQQIPAQLAQVSQQIPQQLDQAGQDEPVSVQDVMGLVGSMGEQQRKTKDLQAQLLEAQMHEKQLNGLVLSETYRSNSVDQNVRLVAQQMEALKNQVYDSNRRLAAETSKRQSLDAQLSQTRSVLQDLQAQVVTAHQKEVEAINARQVAEKRAQTAEAREVNALKAGELEEMALNQQEELLHKMQMNQQGSALSVMPEMSSEGQEANTAQTLDQFREPLRSGFAN